MSTPLLNALAERHRLPLVDAENIDAFLVPAQGEALHSLLFFPGAGANRPETSDVAVILPEILQVFAERLRGAVIAPAAEEKLKARFQVYVYPALVVVRGGDPVGVLPKIYDWSEYLHKIEAFLDPAAPVLSGPKGPKVAFTHSQGA